VKDGGRRAAIPHVAALDGARGLAVAGVLLFHGGHLLGGYLGVDFFFTLSGFLITSLLLAESSRTGSIGLGGFWARRARRLLPALAVLMVGVALYSIGLAKPEELAQIRGDALATLGYAANWRAVYAHVDYWALFRAPSPLNHTWSLAIEEQFYVIWPLLFVGLLAWWKRAAPKAVLVTSLVLAGVSSILMVALYDPANTNRSYFGTDTRAAAILFGAALAAWLAIHGPTKNRRARIALESVGVAGAVVLALAWTRLDGQSSTLYRGGFLVCGLAATAVIAAAVDPEPGILARVLSLRPLCLLGLISYGVYLYHWPIDIVLDQKRLGVGGWPLFAVQTAATLAVAVASYRIVEQPIRRGAVSSGQLRKLTPAIAIGLVVALVVSTNGARPLPNVGAAPDPALATYGALLASRSAPPGAQRVMIVGNSVAADLTPGFKSVRAEPPLAFFNGGIPACVFPPQIVTTLRVRPSDIPLQLTPCDPSWEPRTLQLFRPEIVFWIMSDAGEPWHYRGRAVKPCSEPYESLYQDGLRREIARLGALGAKVVITTEAYVRFFHSALPDYAVDCNNRLRRKVAAATGAQLVDLFTYTCPNGKCPIKQNGVTMRPDGLHYTGRGGEIVAKWLIDQVRRKS
jgi:peptidoglycan/LPS O-acetylase OafA/YrhL